MMTKQYDSTFTCAKGVKWDIRFKLSQIVKFCGEYGLKMDRILPELLDAEQILKLSFIGIQHHADAVGITYDMWLDGNLDGEALAHCNTATEFGLINFILPRLPEKKRVFVIATLEDLLKIDDENESEDHEGGAGQTVRESL